MSPRRIGSEPNEPPGRFMVFAPHSRDAPTRSGIHRVAMRLIEHLPRHAHVDLVKWDELEGQLRYCDKNDLRRYFKGAPPNGIAIHPFAHRTDYRFADTVPKGQAVVMLMPEAFYLAENGNEIHGRVIAQCLAAGWTTAAVFYDLIPLKSGGYAERDISARALAELMRVDVVLPISQFSLTDLRAYLSGTVGIDLALLERSGQRMEAVLLPDRDRPPVAVASGIAPARDTIVLLGTIEPRKQQIRIIRAFQKCQLASKAGLRLVVIGSTNPHSDAELRSLVATDPSVIWLGHASDAQIDAAFRAARFSVFLSREEGFGLPIVESLCRGVPCLTSEHGAMREAAAGGGCLLVDADEGNAIEAALERLATSDVEIKRLRAEIARRTWRTWDDYVGDVLAAIRRFERPAAHARTVAACLATKLVAYSDRSGMGRQGGVSSEDAVALIGVDAAPDHSPDADMLQVASVAGDAAIDALPQATFDAIVAADAWFCRSAATYDAIVSRAAGAGPYGLLSGHCGWQASQEPFAAMVASTMAALVERRRCRAIAAMRDGVFRHICKGLGVPQPSPILAIVISVFNGADFIERNIVHTLQLVRPFDGLVRLLVVDNASTDGTPGRVERFAARGDVDLIRVACNTGLLGNLRKISTLFAARHVWAIGVDDIIVPGAIERILAVLAKDPNIPFLLPNFSVYHRDGFAPTDTCARLLNESTPVGVDCGPDQESVVRRATEHHDNLLTAFYIMIGRSDLMSTIFNQSFTGAFFGSLVDTIPTTKVAYEIFAEFGAVWLADPVIAGNAHNTWRHHRVAWHGVLMPQAFELAREAGVDRHRLREWARQHIGLLKEANDLYPNPSVADSFPGSGLEPSFRVFGTWLPPLHAETREQGEGRRGRYIATSSSSSSM